MREIGQAPGILAGSIDWTAWQEGLCTEAQGQAPEPCVELRPRKGLVSVRSGGSDPPRGSCPREEQWGAGRRGRAGGGAGPLSTSSVLVGGTQGRGARRAEGSHRQAEPAAMALVGPVIWGPRRDVYLLLLLLLLLPPWVPAGECG